MERKWERKKKRNRWKKAVLEKATYLTKKLRANISILQEREKEKKNQRFDQCLQWPWFSMEKKGDCRKKKSIQDVEEWKMEKGVIAIAMANSEPCPT